MKYIIDTNVLLDYPQIVENTQDTLIIPTTVLKELDGLKKSINNDIAFNARRAGIYISKNIEHLHFFEECEQWNIPVDDQLLAISKNTGGTILTNDVYLKVRAMIKKIPVESYTYKDNYDGICYWFLDGEDEETATIIENIYSTGNIPQSLKKDLVENQYLIIKDTSRPILNKYSEKDFEILGTFVYRDGKIRGTKNKNIKNMWINCIVPRNPEQVCLFDALHNRNISILYAGGSFGRGKSFILNNFALQELETEKIKKIVYVPNNAFTENTMEIGALPGELLPKIEGQIGPLIDLVGIDKVQDMINRDQLEIVPMSFIRGRSFSDSIVIVNESQNLTEDHIKLLIARCGEGTRIFFDGDIKQADSQLFRNKNGLKLLLNLHKSPIYSKIFATVKLLTTERSNTAQTAQFLDDIAGIM